MNDVTISATQSAFLRGVSVLLLGLFGACKSDGSTAGVGALAGPGGTAPTSGIDLNLSEGGASSLAGAAGHGQGPGVPECESFAGR